MFLQYLINNNKTDFIRKFTNGYWVRWFYGHEDEIGPGGGYHFTSYLTYVMLDIFSFSVHFPCPNENPGRRVN